MSVVTSAEWSTWNLRADLADARYELRQVLIAQLPPHWSSVGRQYLRDADRDARATR
jgi:hypothetical protein